MIVAVVAVVVLVVVCGCACDGGCGCCGCGGGGRRRRLPSKGRVGLILKKTGGGREGRAQRLPPQCVLCD